MAEANSATRSEHRVSRRDDKGFRIGGGRIGG
jgi:hypothetical protein